MTRVAIVHDYLTQCGGAERVVLSMLEAFPDAELYTSVYNADTTFDEFRRHRVHTLPLQWVGAFRRHHRWALPLYPLAFERLVVDADVMIASSSGWAHGARTTGRKIVYCYNPARWLYQTDEYMSEDGGLVRRAMSLARPAFRWWDRRAADSADRYVAISSVVAQRVASSYGVGASLLPPPVTLDAGGPAERPDVGSGRFFLTVSRLLPYKNIDALLDAFARLPRLRLVVPGSGPDAERLARLAPANVVLLGHVTEPQLRWLYAHCIALVSASVEDFGLTPVEAATFGRPSAVLRRGGFVDTVREGVNGVFFDAPSPALIGRALDRILDGSWDADAIRVHAEAYSEERFAAKLRDLVGP